MKKENNNGYILLTMLIYTEDDYNIIVSEFKDHFKNEKLKISQFDGGSVYTMEIIDIYENRFTINLDFSKYSDIFHNSLISIRGDANGNDIILNCQGCKKLQLFLIDNGYITVKPHVFEDCISLKTFKVTDPSKVIFNYVEEPYPIEDSIERMLSQTKSSIKKYLKKMCLKSILTMGSFMIVGFTIVILFIILFG